MKFQAIALNLIVLIQHHVDIDERHDAVNKMLRSYERVFVRTLLLIIGKDKFDCRIFKYLSPDQLLLLILLNLIIH